jgi:hypothetical protein
MLLTDDLRQRSRPQPVGKWTKSRAGGSPRRLVRFLHAEKISHADRRPVRDSGQGGLKLAVFENRSGVYVLVLEHRKRRKEPFAGRHHLNINRPYIGFAPQ